MENGNTKRADSLVLKIVANNEKYGYDERIKRYHRALGEIGRSEDYRLKERAYITGRLNDKLIEEIIIGLKNRIRKD